ncbi:MAG: CPBP family intramembrane metalloprotease [Pseudomonadota bacterium]|nr:CPBP family intramembrane metalloprotease [Pseudomonadota bacterium]
MVRRLAVFYAVALAWSLASASIAFLGPRLVPDVPAPTWLAIAGMPYMFGPLVGALVASRQERTRFVEAVGLRWKPNGWWVLAWFAPVPFIAAVIVVSALAPGVDLATPLDAVRARYGGVVSPSELADVEASLAAVPPLVVAVGGTIAGLIAGASINALFAFGEEAGWRGYLPRVLREARFWPAALGTGALWGLWHAPLVLQGYNFPEQPVVGVACMVLACALLSPPLLWLRGKAGSVLAAALFHGTLNGVAGMTALFLLGGTSFSAGPLGIPACLVLAVVNALLLAAVPPGAKMAEVVPTD